MVAVQLVWRVLDSENNVVQAFPEFIAAAISRLTPISWFGTVTETYGSLAKRSLLTACIIGVIALGPVAGRLAYALTRRRAPGLARRLVAAGAVAAALLAVTLLVILPVANLGVAARESSYTDDILTQLVLTFALWAVLWSVLSAEPEVRAAADGVRVSRRSALQSIGWAVLGIGALAGVTGSLVDMFRTRKPSAAEVASQEQKAADIIATQQPVQAMQTATPVAINAATVDFKQLEASGSLTSVLTLTKDFYHVSKNFTDPTVSSDGWELEIGGMVAAPLKLTYDDLLGRATTKNITTLCCISNELNGNLISTAEWTGVPLADLFAEAGIDPAAVDLKFSAADDYTESIPAALLKDRDILLVVGMNGEPLPDDHGFPARLIVPPIYGMKNVKWIHKIEAVDSDYMGYWQERGWSDTAIYQIWGRIDYPRNKLVPGPTVACGVASAGDRGVQRVEVSLDDAATWVDAELVQPLNDPFTWVRWAFPFEAVTGSMKLTIRVTDGQGQVMEESERAPLPDGATGWPSRKFTVE
jgi:DMSO/TMAO reductase YedYZ molybdopterin-dependent catalytic subunit